MRLGREPQAGLGRPDGAAGLDADLGKASSRPCTFDEFYKQMTGYSWHLASRYFVMGMGRDDVQQIAMIGCWEAWTTFDPSRGELDVFAMGCMRRVVLEAVTHGRRQKRFTEDGVVSLERLDWDLVPDALAADPFDEVVERERVAAVVECVAGMTDLERLAVEHRVNGHLYSQDSSLDNGLQRARRKIADALRGLEEAA